MASATVVSDRITFFISGWTPLLLCATVLTVTLTVQGRLVRPVDLAQIRQWLSQYPHWSRRRLSQALCAHWNWRNGAGQFKDMASRALLRKLEAGGYIQLPARRQVASQRMGQTPLRPWGWESSACRGSLREMEPLRVREVSQERAGREEVTAALGQFHYLGFRGTVGENLLYTVQAGSGRLLACLVFGAAAWQCQDRDRFIGWTAAQRKANLFLLANNSRFLVLPWVEVPGLASWTLSTVRRRLSRDWQAKYGHPIYLVETFVERDRFGGTAYRAANWLRIGETTGRTRQDRFHVRQTPIKDVYVYPLQRSFRPRLCA